jgi:hypothetical protein
VSLSRCGYGAAPQSPETQRPVVQSVPTTQALPWEHWGHVGPPQSTSVSLPFFTPSVQVGAMQWQLLQTPDAQSLLPAHVQA